MKACILVEMEIPLDLDCPPQRAKKLLSERVDEIRDRLLKDYKPSKYLVKWKEIRKT
jgi:hypothetical protein